MEKMRETFKRVTDDNGEAYYCPMNAQNKTAPAVESEACVEASTVERYSGNLDIPD